MPWSPVEGSSTWEYNITPTQKNRNQAAFQAQQNGKRTENGKTIFYQIRKKK